MSDSEYRRSLDAFAKENGWQIERLKGGNLRLTHTKTGARVTATAHSHDKRTLLNVKGDMKRAVRAFAPVAIPAPVQNNGFTGLPKTSAAQRRSRKPDALRALSTHTPTGSFAKIENFLR
ncbi:MAG: hypothetical protein KGQ41_03420 [Alphaproteobacteria bacterium]|nr:hypothetical protein [Alphaproteobacteria bacterium]